MDNPLQDNNLTGNQMANQGVPDNESNVKNLSQNNIPTGPAKEMPTPKTSPTQEQTYGKSELLDSLSILRDFLQLKIGNMVGDLGAGGGLFSVQAARLVGGQGQVYAVDILKSALSEIDSKARMSGLDNIKTVWSNIEIIGATKINEKSLDAVMLVNVLFQSTKHFEILSEAERLIKSGGKLLVVDWNDSSSSFSPSVDRKVNPQSIIQLSEKLGLSLENEFRAGNYHFGLIFTK